MSFEQEFTCPVCKAKQTLRDECRRCSADLALYAKAIRSLAYASDKIADLDSNKYLQWLKGAGSSDPERFPSSDPKR